MKAAVLQHFNISEDAADARPLLSSMLNSHAKVYKKGESHSHFPSKHGHRHRNRKPRPAKDVGHAKVKQGDVSGAEFMMGAMERPAKDVGHAKVKQGDVSGAEFMMGAMERLMMYA